MSPHRQGLIQVFIASICFGLIGLFGKNAFAAGVSVGELLSLRFILAAVILGAGLLIFRRQDLRLSKKQLFISAGLGICGYTLFATLYFTSIRGVSIALAALLLYTYPFWTLLFNLLLGHRLKARQGFSLLGASVGLVLLLWGQMSIESGWAVAAGIGSAVAYSIYILVSGHWQKNVSPLSSGFWIIGFAALALTIKSPPDFARMAEWSPFLWMNLIALAVVGTVIPLTLTQAGLQKLTAQETAILSMFEPVSAALASWIFLGEGLEGRQLLGGIVVLISLVFGSFKKQDLPPAGSL